jgi:enoyl-CoA hydratase/carnithine racemase
LTGRTFTGAEARDLGVASRVLPNDDVLPHALEVAHDMAVNTAPLSVAVSKRLLWGTFSMTPDEVDRAETDLHHHLMGEADAREGVTAFLERRDPEWSLTVNNNWPSEWPTPGDIT